MEGKGLPVRWESLVQALRDTSLSELADKIKAFKIPTGGVGEEEVEDYSECVCILNLWTLCVIETERVRGVRHAN